MVSNRIKQQKGVVFIISVIMLLVLAGLSLTILSTSVSEKAQSRQTQEGSLAQLSANNATAAAKQDLLDLWWLGHTECTSAPCTCTDVCVWASATFDGIDFTGQDSAWWNDYGTEIPQANVSESPRYIIINEGCDLFSEKSYYRIVSRGVGTTSNSVAYSNEGFTVPISLNNTGDFSVSSNYELYQDGNFVASQALSSSQMGCTYGSGSGSPLCPAGYAVYAQCEVGCGGYFRVMAWSYQDDCIPKYGPWTYVTDSSVTVTYTSGESTFTCVRF